MAVAPTPALTRDLARNRRSSLARANCDRPDVFHMNEGHVAFLVVEMWIRGMQSWIALNLGSVYSSAVCSPRTPQFLQDMIASIGTV